MKTPQRPVWSEGLFLMPQHLQAVDRFHEATLSARIGAAAGPGWGVSEVELSASALGAGQLRVTRFRGVLPDGLVLDFGESAAEAPPARSVGELLGAHARSLEVFLGVAREREGVPSYVPEGPEARAARARFVITSRQVADATGGQPGNIAFARPNVELLLGGEARDEHETIKIAEVVRSASGTLALDETFIPPLLRVGASGPLSRALRDLTGQLVAVARDLLGSAGRSSARGARAAELTTPELTRLLQLLVINGSLPVLTHLCDSLDASPALAYVWLCQLAGQLATLVGEAPSAPAYQHTDLRATFGPLLASLRAALGGVAQERFLRIPLELRGNLHLARLDDERTLHGRLILGVVADVPETQVLEALPRLAKLASGSEIHGLVQAAAPGVTLEPLARPPGEIPPRAGAVYFSISTGHPLWKGVVGERSLALYLPPPFDPGRAKVELFAVPAAP